MIGQCKFCANKISCHICKLRDDEFGCKDFLPSELLLESEEAKLIKYINLQKYETFKYLVKEKIKHTEPGDNYIEICKVSGDKLIIPIDDDYLDYAAELLEEFLDDGYSNDLNPGDTVSFKFDRITAEQYKKICELSEDFDT